MFYSFSFISFIVFAHHFLIPISNASPSVEDKMLIAFIKGQQERQLSEYSIHKYEAHLGIVNYMRKSWKCEKIDGKFEEYERTKCQTYRKYLEILYEYLFREYDGIPTVKPRFVFNERIEIEGSIIYAVNCLFYISQFYFKSFLSKIYGYKLNKYFYFFQPKLLNEKRLNYAFKLENGQKMPINEMILQLAIDTANEWQTNESLDGIIRQNFEEHLKEMFKKAEEIAKKDNPGRADLINNDKHFIILIKKFDDKSTWTEDALFSEFVKGLATNFGKFFQMAKEYSNYINRMIEKGNINWDDEEIISLGLNETEKMKDYLKQQYEAHLGLMYLMRKKWKCDKIRKKTKEKCKKYRKYLDILYEYLFQLYAEGKSADLANKLPAVKPIFIDPYSFDNKRDLISVVQNLNEVSKCYWSKLGNFNYIYRWELLLLNEVELNYKIKEEQNLLEKINGPKNVQKKGKNILNFSNEIEDNLRQEFQQKMQKMYENTKKMPMKKRQNWTKW